MPQEESIQKPQTTITLPDLPLGAKVIIPVLGLPVALHALTGAAVGALTFAVGALFVGLTQGNLPKPSGQSSRKSTVASETTG